MSSSLHPVHNLAIMLIHHADHNAGWNENLPGVPPKGMSSSSLGSTYNVWRRRSAQNLQLAHVFFWTAITSHASKTFRPNSSSIGHALIMSLVPYDCYLECYHNRLSLMSSSDL